MTTKLMIETMEAADCACPMCGGNSGALGVLGNALWLQCRNCGWEFDVKATIEEEN